MKELNFSTGVETYKINESCTLSFNPTDANLIERVYNAFDKLKEIQDELESASGIDAAEEIDLKEFFDLSRRRDKEMRDIIDGVFGEGVGDSLFSGMHCYASGDGLPAWCNFFLAIFDEIDAVSDDEHKKSSERIRQYTEKYKKKRAKKRK